MAQTPRFPLFFALVIATVALFAQTTNAWSFLWRNDKGEATIEAGMTNQSCKAIDQGKNQPFEWDPKSDPFCISLFSDKKCQSRAGYTCNPWPHDSSRALLSFEVNGTLTTGDDIFSTSSATTESATTTTASMTTSVKTDLPVTDSATSSPQTGSGDDSGDSLSGGAIAGIVIGVVAVIVLVIIAWLMYRRRRQTPPPQGSSSAGYSAGGPVAPMSESDATTATGTTAVGSAPPISKWGAPTSPAEPRSPTSPTEPLSAAPAYSPAPPEGTKMAELSDSHQIVELQGSDPVPSRSLDNIPHEKP